MDLRNAENATVNWIIFLVIAFSASIGLTTYARSVEKLYDIANQTTASVQEGTTTQPVTNTNTKKMTTATIQTSKGTITLELFSDKAPKTVENFVKLATTNFYDGVKFHRVIKGFMIQTGDPLSKDDSQKAYWGTGGPGYKFADEINKNDALYTNGYARGILAMANSGPNTNGSQFFIMHADYPLSADYTIFGKVVSGIEVVDAIATSQTGARDVPLEAIAINTITIQK